MRQGRAAGNPQPSEREFAVLSALWSLGSGTVAEVRDELIAREEFEPAYTTVLTQLRVLEAKRWVRAVPEGRAHRYVPVLGLDDARRDAVARVIGLLYDGSRERFLLSLVGDRHVGAPLLRRLKDLVERRLRDAAR